MKALIIYYSNSGTTAKLAEKIHDRFGGGLIEVKAKVPYGSYLAAVKRAGTERKKGIIAEYEAPDADLSDIDTVFVGYPIWYSDAPLFFLDYLSKLKLEGKTVIPFSTSGATNIKATLGKLEDALKVKATCPYNSGKFSKDDFEAWAEEVSKL